MARRKKQFLDDGSSSSSSDTGAGDDVDDHFDANDPDVAAERELFHNPYGRSRGTKRTREQLKDDATYGIWADDNGGSTRAGGQGVGSSSSSNNRTGGSRARGKPDYHKIPTFVAAGAAPSSASASRAPTDNLATTPAIEAPREDEEDVAMELGGSSSDDNDDNADEGDDALMSAEDIASHKLEEDEDEDEDEADDLPPVPGLASAAPPSPEPAPEPRIADPSAALAFAPRGARGGIGARAGIGGRGGRGGGGIGAAGGGGGGGGGGAGIGAARGGIGSASRGGIGSRSGVAPAFAAAQPAPAPAPAPASTTAPSSGAASPMAGASTPHAGLGSGAGGPSRGGIGSRPNQTLVDALRAELAGPAPQSPAETATDSLASSAYASRTQSPAPTGLGAAPVGASAGAGAAARGDAPRERRSFLPTASNMPPGGGIGAPRAKLSKTEAAHFASLASSGSIGMRMLEKMGWSAGAGLGKEGQGIVTPVGEGQKLRQKNAGIRSGERSKGALLEEERRKGKSTDDDDVGDGATRAAAAAEKKRAAHANAWQSSRPKKEKKAKTEYKTYDEIVAEQGGPDAEAPQELLVDLTGQALPNQSLSSLPAFGAASADPTRLPELRHNLTLLCSTFTSSLRSLAREGAGVEQRRAYLSAEEQRMRRVVEAQERKLAQLRGVVACVERVRAIEGEAMELLRALEAQQDAQVADAEAVLGRFDDEFDRLLGDFAGEYDEMGLDEVVVGAIAPLLRRLWSSWDPLSSPSFTVPQLKRFRKLFRIDRDALPVASANSDPHAEADRLAEARKRQGERTMTPYETLLWTVWLPRVRSAINNSWSPSNPEPAVDFYTAWLPLLPSFVRDNILDQLILPKVSSAIADWSPSAAKRGTAPPLHKLVFPWLEHAGERMDMVLDEAKRKVRSWLKAWKARDGVPQGLDAWKSAFSKSDWDTLLLKHVLPQLGATLRESFVVNPRAQDLAPLEAVLAWRPLLRSSMLSQLLEQEFFPKWGDALYVWLTSEPNLEQVAEWYSWWKSFFAEDVVALSGVSRGFRKGLDLMNQAMALGDDAKYRLKKPDFASKYDRSTASSSTASTPKPSARAPARPSFAAAAAAEDPEDVTFRSVVEEVSASANLVFLPTGKVAPAGQATFRVSRGVDGKGGVTVYLEDDVVWVLEKGGEYAPVSVEEMVRRASGAKA